MKIPEEARKLIEEGFLYLGTSSQEQPNVTVTQSGVVLDDENILVCDCEMSLSKENILKNPNCSFIICDQDKNLYYKGFGEAKYYDSEKYLEIAKKRLTKESYNPKGVIVIRLNNIFKVV